MGYCTNPNNEISWKEGYLAFNHEDLRSMMNKISRWYHVPVIYRGLDEKTRNEYLEGKY